jgi:hypothetical protein
VDQVVPFLEDRGLRWIRIHLSDFPQRMKAAYGIDIHLSEFRLGDTRISLDDVVSVWYRRTEAINLPANIKGEDRRFARAECQSFIKGLWHATAHRNWVSFPDAIRGASDKAEQLWRARRHGFNVPKTLFSNDAAAVRSFWALRHQAW